MKNKFFSAAILAAALLLCLTACGKAQTPAASDDLDSTTIQTEQQNHGETSAIEDTQPQKEETPEEETTPTISEETSQDETTPTNGEIYGEEAAPTGTEEVPADEAWKETFEASIFESYGVVPESYEDLGDGIYQVYVKMGDGIVPFVTVDSATGDYHG